MIYVILTSVLIGIVLGLLLFYLLSRRGIRKNSLPVQEAAFSERDAENLLRKSGYQIMGKKQKETIITRVNDKERFGYLEVDYLVRKDRKKYAVLVHLGEGSSDPNEPVLRRRLIECDRAFSPEGMLVLDLNRGEIHRVKFHFPHETSIDAFFRFLIALFIILGVIGIIWVMAALNLF
jgi:hypothetical protein